MINLDAIILPDGVLHANESHSSETLCGRPIDPSVKQVMHPDLVPCPICGRKADELAGIVKLTQIESPMEQIAFTGLELDPPVHGLASPVTSRAMRLGHSESAPAFRPKKFVEIPLLYGTSRKAVGRNITDHFGVLRNTHLNLGECFVRLRYETRWEFDIKNLWNKPFKRVTHKDYQLIGLEELHLTAFKKRLQNIIEDETDVLLFIHGFNVDFAGAAVTAGKLLTDLNFPGRGAFYSWCSYGALQCYRLDEANVSQGAAGLMEFISLLGKNMKRGRIHLVAHSMGCRALCRVAAHSRFPDQKIGHLIFVAPDVDAETFQDFWVPGLRKSGRATLYANGGDKALAYSMAKHAYRRAGQGGESIVTAKELDSVDATDLDMPFFDAQHSPPFTESEGHADLRALLMENKPPQKRGLKKKQSTNGGTYWGLKESG